MDGKGDTSAAAVLLPPPRHRFPWTVSSKALGAAAARRVLDVDGKSLPEEAEPGSTTPWRGNAGEFAKVFCGVCRGMVPGGQQVLRHELPGGGVGAVRRTGGAGASIGGRGSRSEAWGGARPHSRRLRQSSGLASE